MRAVTTPRRELKGTIGQPNHDIPMSKNPVCSGQRYGQLVTLSIAPRKPGVKSRSRNWLCRCDCGKSTTARAQSLKQGDAKSCGCWKNRVYGELAETYLTTVKNNAASRGMEFDLNGEWLWNLFMVQEEKCALSGEPITMDRFYGRKLCKQTASLDRKDSSLGYTKDNVQWVHKQINRMKMDMTDDELVAWSHKIYRHSQKT